MQIYPKSPKYIDEERQFVENSLPISLAWMANENIEPPFDLPEYADNILFSVDKSNNEEKRFEAYLKLFRQLVKIDVLSQRGDTEKLEFEKQKYLKQIAILEMSYRYLDKIEETEIAGKSLRTTQKIAAFGFRDFVQDNLFVGKLMGHVVQPVGAGKTNIGVMLSEMVDGRTVFIPHHNGDDILKSFAEHQESLHPVARKSVGQCFGGKMETENDIMVAHFASAHKWLPSIDWNSVGLVVVDEADINALSEKRRELLEDLSEKYGIPIVGMSATEEQGSGKILQDAFPKEICRLGMPDGLVKCLELGITPQMKFSDLHLDLEMVVDEKEIKRLSDIPDESVDEFIRSTNWIELILQDYLSKYKEGDRLKPSILVLRDNLLVDTCLEKARENGIRAVAYTGNLSLEQREQCRKDLAEGKIDMLVGSKLVGRGLHIPEVEVVYNSTITWSPQMFWQADGRGASIDNNNSDKISNVIAVLPRTMNDKKSGLSLPPESRPFSHSTFFDPAYFEGREDRLLNLDNEFSVLKRRTSIPDRQTYYEYNLGGLETVRSIREVHDLIKKLRNKPDGFASRGRIIARYIDSLGEDTHLTIGLLRHIISMLSIDIRIDAENYEIEKEKHESYLEIEDNSNENRDADVPLSVQHIEKLSKNAPIFTKSEEDSLFERIKAGDEEAKKIVVHSYLPLILSIAKKMHVSGFDLSDLVNEGIEGVMGLFKDLRKKRGGFSGYVLIKCFRSIQRLIRNESRDVRLKENVYGDMEKVNTNRERLIKRLLYVDKISEEIVTDEEIDFELAVQPKDRKEFSKANDIEKALYISKLYNAVISYLKETNAQMTLGRKAGAHWTQDRTFGTGYHRIDPDKVAEDLDISLEEMRKVLFMDSKGMERANRLVGTHNKIALTEQIRGQLFQEYKDGTQPTIRRVAKMLGVKLEYKHGNKWDDYNMEEVSLDEKRQEAELEMVNYEDTPSDNVIASNLAEQTRRVMKSLTPQEEKVLCLRFGICEESDYTLEEIAEDFEVTPERIRQIESKALRKLRHSSRSKHLRKFFED